jgi:glycosyltransferase involved in cell wall biosynthesis
MKIAVYTIALNEEQYVEKWFNSAKDADYLLIADTGSTDNSVALAKSLGINVVSINVQPWRFEVARNAALSAIPLDIDYCIALDMDEVLLPGWREELEKSFEAGATRPRYKYTWSWKEDGSPGLQYGGDKIHSRKNYMWRHPVHEVLGTYGMDEIQHWNDLEIHHYPDSTKSRGQYFPLLAMSVKENPHDDRNSHYYARELFFHGRLEEAAEEFKRHLSLPSAVWGPEKAASCRYLAKCEPDKTEFWLLQANVESVRRENFIALAQFYYENAEWEKCLSAAQSTLEIKEKPLDYLCEEIAWGEKPYDLGAISAYNLGDLELAKNLGKKAVEFSPNDERLINNLKHYMGEK